VEKGGDHLPGLLDAGGIDIGDDEACFLSGIS
jgi:hypothetical protein